MTRAKADTIVIMPLVADLYESLFEKYIGVRYSTREMYLNRLRARFQKLFFFSALSDLDE
jgi:hypothetical protein